MELYKKRSVNQSVFLKVYIKMEKTVIKFDDTEIQKQQFHQHKKIISIKIWILVK